LLRNRGVPFGCCGTSFDDGTAGASAASLFWQPGGDAYSRDEVGVLSLVANQVERLAVGRRVELRTFQHATEALRASEEGFA